MPTGKYTRNQSIKERFESYISMEPNTGCHLWTGATDKDGYGQFMYKGKTRAKRAHRAAWVLYVGPLPDDIHLLHTCDTRPCVNTLHLKKGDQADNMEDCIKKGRNRPIDPGYRCKLTEEQVRKIRSDTRLNRIIAKEYGVSDRTISSVKLGQTYCHVNPL
jgi:hypothetical protein